MAKFSDFYGGSFLTAAEIPAGREARVTIDRVAAEHLDDGEKLVVYFAGKQKGLVLNKTNGSVIASAYGDETDHWPGRQIVLFRSQVLFSGRMVDCLRVRIPDGQQPLRPNMPPPAQPDPQAYDAGPAQQRYAGAEPDGDAIPF